MAIIKLQGSNEKAKGIFYEFDTNSAPLGEGGMGKVYHGRCVNEQTGVTKDVAIKFMFEGLAPSVIERARREANIQIKSDNLVEMMGFFTTEERMKATGQTLCHYHVVSELLIGVSLSDLLKGVVTTANGEKIAYAEELYTLYKTNPYEFAAIVIRQLLSGLMALHDAGYIHRDIDPSNIMITANRKIKLIDFGIAKHLTTLATQDKHLTSAGQFIGKAQYAAPELVLGDVLHQDRTTDIYAVGIMFYQLITGRLPFDGSTTSVISAQLKQKIDFSPIKNGQARRIIARATEKEQQKRYGSVAEFRVDIEKFDPNAKGGTMLPTLLKWVVPSVAVVIIAVAAILLWPKAETNETDEVVVVHGTEKLMVNKTIESLVCELYDPEKAHAAWIKLQQISEQKNNPNRAQALFVQSRAYFDYTVKSDKNARVYDSEVNAAGIYQQIQNNLKDVVKPNQKKAHELLLHSIEVDPQFYPALYEMSWDYVWGDLRGTQRDPERDGITLVEYLERTLQAAQAAKDTIYPKRVEFTNSTFLEY